MVLTSDIENDIILQQLRFWSTEVHLVLMMVLSPLACRNYVPIKLIMLPCCEMVILFLKKQPDGCDDDLVIVISISWFIACSLLLPLRSFSCQFLFWDYQLCKVLFCSLPFIYGDATVSPSMILYSCNITSCFSFWPLLNYLMGREGFGQLLGVCFADEGLIKTIEAVPNSCRPFIE